MEWIELIVHTTSAGSDPVSLLLMELGAGGTMIEDRADIPDPSKPHGIWEIIDPDLPAKMPEDVLVHAWFAPDSHFPTLLNELQLRLQGLKARDAAVGSLTLDRQSVRDEDWKEVWKKYYKPFHISETLVIKPTWEPYTPAPGEKVLQLDPGMAFGSGTHETTGMCMSLLETVLKSGDTVIDVGTGSGILAIGAALLGAGSVLAVDIDPDAVRVANENVRLNGTEDRVTVLRGDLLTEVHEACDICIANIISDIIISFAPSLITHIRPGGLFICSGIVRERGNEVRTALENAGYHIQRKEIRGEWVAFLCERK